jgi:starch phosphorylase
MTVADFADYARAHRDIEETYRNERKFGNMSLTNIAKAGLFSSDRAVEEYARNIWYLK